MHYLWDNSRNLLAVVAAIFIGWRLMLAGWPWWAWLPAAMLGALAFLALNILCWFGYRKLTYQYFARAHKRRRTLAGH